MGLTRSVVPAGQPRTKSGVNTMSKFNDSVMKNLEQAFGKDLSDVRSNSDQANRNLGAQAFTQGNDVHFNPGKNDPNSSNGKQLLGHELTHVVQQGQSNGFSQQGAKQLMEGNVPTNPADRARLRSTVPHTGPAGAPLSAGVGPLVQNKPVGYVN